VPFRSIEDPVKLRRLMSAMLLLESNLSLPQLLRHLIEEACSMVGARYGAVGVLNHDRSGLAEFVTVGLSAEEEERIGPRPTGKGVLGLLIHEPVALRLGDIRAHPDSSGFPPNHPPMTSFLGVPVKVRDEVYGNLYLTDKIGWSEFTEDDEKLVAALALAAGIAIENAHLHQRVQDLAVVDERDRIARDLHDAVIQRLFAVGLSLQGLARLAGGDTIAERLSRAVEDIDDTIRQIRSTIFELGAAVGVPGVRAAVLDLVRDLDDVIGFDVQVQFIGPVDTMVSEAVSEHLLATAREALTNVGRHAEASEASLLVAVEGGLCVLRVTDNGVGIDAGRPGRGDGGLGLVNLRRRADKLGGEFSAERGESGGTVLIWRVPLVPVQVTGTPAAEGTTP
jgi:signal transduction histidine kinase